MQAVVGQAPGFQFPGFDGLRLAAAGAVLFSHAFLIAGDSHAYEPPYYLPGNYGIITFFIISSFLLTRVLAKGSAMVEFSLNRLLRIVPGFLFCTLSTSLVIGALVTPLDLRAYYTQHETYAYIVSSVMCLCDSWEKPFAFAAYPKLVGAINGSLWSL